MGGLTVVCAVTVQSLTNQSWVSQDVSAVNDSDRGIVRVSLMQLDRCVCQLVQCGGDRVLAVVPLMRQRDRALRPVKQANTQVILKRANLPTDLGAGWRLFR